MLQFHLCLDSLGVVNLQSHVEWRGLEFYNFMFGFILIYWNFNNETNFSRNLF